MDRETTNYYKLVLAQDLISFLVNIYLRNVPLEHKAKSANTILEHWESRVDEQLKTTMDQVIKRSAEMQAIDEDVMAIITGIHRIEPEIIRKEFKVETRHSLFRSFMEQPEDK